MAEDIIRYDVLVQEALRSVVRKVLAEAARAGLPGEHHFYIAFDTAAPGVRLSSRIRQKYPEEMTIVLQHQFWDFVVTDTQLEVTLSFGGVAERLVVPFTAVKGFFDPSVQFGLQFDPSRNADATPAVEMAPADAGPKPALASSEGRTVAPAEKPAHSAKAPARASVPTTAAPKPAPEAEPVAASATGETDAADAPADAPAPSAAVVSLDAFRKKT
jgi:hypothetical protein